MKITLTDIQKKYGDFEVLKGISTEFEEGKFYGLLGPNGAGKTTLFNILIQATHKTSGHIEWQIDGDKVKADTFYHHVGIVFQSSRLDERLTVEENLITRGALYGLNKRQVFQSLKKFEEYLSIKELRTRRYGMLSEVQRDEGVYFDNQEIGKVYWVIKALDEKTDRVCLGMLQVERYYAHSGLHFLTEGGVVLETLSNPYVIPESWSK